MSKQYPKYVPINTWVNILKYDGKNADEVKEYILNDGIKKIFWKVEVELNDDKSIVVKKYFDKENIQNALRQKILIGDYIIRNQEGNCWAWRFYSPDDAIDKHYMRIVAYIKPRPYGLVNTNKDK